MSCKTPTPITSTVLGSIAVSATHSRQQATLMMISSPRISVVLAALLITFSSHAESVYQQPADFIASIFVLLAMTGIWMWLKTSPRKG